MKPCLVAPSQAAQTQLGWENVALVSLFTAPPQLRGGGAMRVNLLKVARNTAREAKEKAMDAIHAKVPRETIGRETTNRFRMQFQAAAFAALEILSGKEVDRVYCDYHDDFVVRRSVSGSVEYHFFQVKTKGRPNQQWRVHEIFSLKKNGDLDTQEKLSAIRDSIAGKLFVHTIEFGVQCREVTVLSNVHFHDDVYEVQQHLGVGESKRAYIARFIEKFNEIFSPALR